MFDNFFSPENCAVDEIMWNMPQIIIWRMRIASWIPKARNTHTRARAPRVLCILIAFPPQEWLHERA
jgi:hypothetical protein